MKSKLLVVFLFLAVRTGAVQAQLSASNILEYRLGNLPNESPTTLTTWYDQLDLTYRAGNITGNIRLEKFEAQNEQRGYAELTERSVRLDDKGFEVTVGNFYEIMGRGLMLRSYELPGLILEDFGFRSRYGFYRDIDGVLVKYQSNHVAIKALRGKPLRNDLPPQPDFADMRRPDVLEGVEANLLFGGGWDLGLSYLRNNHDEDFDGDREYREFASGSVAGNLPFEFQIYTEYAIRLGEDHPTFDVSDNSTHALYSSLNFVRGPVGLSFEFKDYNNFSFYFNDPPPVIKEHSYVVLNRSTHELLALNETGWQAEMYISTSEGHTLTLNVTEAENKFHKKFLFKELFAELQFYATEQMLIKGFFDRSQDPLKSEKDRYAGGVYVENEWPEIFGSSIGSSIDLEYQTFDREGFNNTQKVKNYVTALTVSHSPKYAAGVTWERSTDPAETDNPLTLAVETGSRDWVGYTFGYQNSDRHFFSLFYGKRRGGVACTSGICYRVLDFEGFELTLSSVF